MDNQYTNVQASNVHSNSLAMASLVLGIVSIVMSVFFIFSFPAGATAIVLGHLSKGDGKMNGKAVGGVVTGILGLIFSILVITAFIMAIVHFGSQQGTDLFNDPDFFNQFIEQTGGSL